MAFLTSLSSTPRKFGKSSGGIWRELPNKVCEKMVTASIGDERFFGHSGPYPLAAVAEAARGVAPSVDLILHSVAPLQTASPCDVRFLDNRRYAAVLEKTRAGAVILHPDMRSRLPATAVANIVA